MIATSWRHTTARAVDDQVPDPQLHSHVLLHGAVRRDGRAVAIDSRAWLVHQREVGAAYRTELARELADLGFQVHRRTGRGRRYFELDAIPNLCWTVGQAATTRSTPQSAKDSPTKNGSSRPRWPREAWRLPRPRWRSSCYARQGSSPRPRSG
ncbi:MAG: relaxase domain-containing protein [Solirubrobacteraceae bacterium]